ncbi:MAG: pitrilysin family protein [Bdellovibrionales bacterium]|nr:pitrilysin family protein [Bdellovibrionales bacterium]
MNNLLHYSLLAFIMALCLNIQAEEKPKTMTLSNGLKVYLLEDSSLPYIHFELITPLNSTKDPKSKEGLSSLMAHSLVRGTQNKSAQEVIKELEKLGTNLSVLATRDYTLISVDTLSWNDEKLLNIFGEIITQARFAEKEVEFIKKQTLSSIEKLPESASAFTNRVFYKIIFQGHPYAHSPLGSKKSLQSITAEETTKHYKMLVPRGSLLGVTGNIPADIRQKLEDAFKNWTGGVVEKKGFFSWFRKKPKATEEPLQQKDIPQYTIVHKPGQVQSNIRMGYVSIPRTSKDYMAFQIANVVFGAGALNSHLGLEVREKHGLTYHIRSTLQSYIKQGLFYIVTPTRLAVTREAIDRSLDIVEKFHKNGITQEELDSAKNYYRMQLLKSYEKAENRLSRRMILNYMGLDYDLDDLDRNLRKLKLKDVQKVIKKYFLPENMKIVIFSDHKEIQSQFKDIDNLKVEGFNKFL